MKTIITTKTVGENFATCGAVRTADGKWHYCDTDRPYGFTEAALADAEHLAKELGVAWTVRIDDEGVVWEVEPSGPVPFGRGDELRDVVVASARRPRPGVDFAVKAFRGGWYIG